MKYLTQVTLLAFTAIRAAAEQAPFLQSQHQQGAMTNSRLPSLSDLLQKLPQAQIYASLVRDVDSVTDLIASDPTSSADAQSSRQQQQQQQQRIIVLAPSNAALRALPQKPWRSSKDEDQFGAQEAYAGAAGAERANDNLRQFVQRQTLVLKQEWREGERVKSVGGKQVWWEKTGTQRIVQPGKIVVIGEESASNGDVWIIDGVLGEG